MQNQINIAIYGQDKGTGGADDTRLIFTFPNTNASLMNEAWLKGLFDPRDARDLTNSENVYALWTSSEGNYYGIIAPANDGRNGRQLLCLHVGKRISSSGKIVISTLNNLKSLLLDNNVRDQELIETNLDEFVNSLITDNGIFQNSLKTTKAIRQYQTEAELEKIFTFPKQNEYTNFRCVYAISSNLLIPQQSSFSVINSPIKVIYRVTGQLPDGVTVDRTKITEGGNLNITYTKDGCEPVTKTVIIDGRRNSSLFYVDNELYINDAQTAEIKFQRKVKLRFEDAKTHSLVRDVTINISGKNSISNELILKDQSEYQPIHIKVIKIGYKTQDVNLAASDILRGEKIISLEPKRSRKDLYFITPDDEQTKASVEVEETSAFYQHIQKYGNFIYVKAPSKSKPTINEEDNDIDWFLILKYILWGIIALIILYGSYTAYQLLINDKAPWPFNKSEKVEVEDNIDDQISDNSQDSDEDKKADLDYLKSNENDDCWDKSKLRTQELQELIDNIQNEQIDEAFNHPYKDDPNVNGYWSKSISIYSDIKGKIEDREIKEAFNRSKVGYDKISIKKLNNELVALKNRLNTPSEPSNPQAVSEQKDPSINTTPRQSPFHHFE